jgi:predicted pyridoxine 5'-phosphate oxidase superfamily flavin-nucleotide-binding protein
MNGVITDLAALEACIGKAPGAVNLKVIDHLDAAALRWLAVSPLVFAAFGNSGGIAVTLGGGAPGFARVLDATHFVLPLAALDDPALAVVGAGFGALFLAPGLGETLRVNGRVAALHGDSVEIGVEECFLHCAKALIRSGFWAAAPAADSASDPAGFLATSRFMVVATIDAQGRADVSPKGDPGGVLIQLRDGALCYAERPGNRRADSFRNILMQPRIAVAALLPGATRVAIAAGSARLATDPAVLAGFAVDGKTPKLVTGIAQPSLRLADSAALARAQLWPVGARPDDLDPAAIFAGHVRLNKTGGLQAKLARAMVSIPGMMEKGLQHDYKNNLY